MNNELQSILATLLAFDTTSRESNLEMIDYINRFLSGFGVNAGCSTMTTAKANLYARLGPPGPGVMLSGHTDVVPVDGQRWTVPPLHLPSAMACATGAAAPT